MAGLRGKWAAIAAMVIPTGPALAGSIHTFHFEPTSSGEGNFVYGDRGGEVNFIEATYDQNTNQFSWLANFAGDNAAEAFTLVVNDGPAPFGGAGELAVLFFDATGPSPILTAYGYNGTPLNNSWEDGSPLTGLQAPDQIISSLNETGWISELFVRNERDGSISLGFSIDATSINSFDSMYGTDDEWFGIGFAEMVGVWFNPYSEVETAYGANGFLSEWDYDFENRGWLDIVNLQTVVIPLPPAVWLGMAGLLGVAVARRRRHVG